VIRNNTSAKSTRNTANATERPSGLPSRREYFRRLAESALAECTPARTSADLLRRIERILRDTVSAERQRCAAIVFEHANAMRDVAADNRRNGHTALADMFDECELRLRGALEAIMHPHPAKQTPRTLTKPIDASASVEPSKRKAKRP